MIDLETLYRIEQILLDQGEYDLAHEVSQEITVRQVSKRAILEEVERVNGNRPKRRERGNACPE